MTSDFCPAGLTAEASKKKDKPLCQERIGKYIIVQEELEGGRNEENDDDKERLNRLSASKIFKLLLLIFVF